MEHSGGGDELLRLRREVSELRDLIDSLALKVEYGDEEPHDAFLTRGGVAGRWRSTLNLAIGAILTRATGRDPHQLSPQALVELDELSLALRKAHTPGTTTMPNAHEILPGITGSLHNASEALATHRARGLGREAHRALEHR